MQSLDELVRQVSDLTQTEFAPAEKADLDVLKRMGAPETILAFYKRYEPCEVAECGCSISPVQAIEDMIDEGGPATAASKAGLIPFGTEMDGDALCFDPARLDGEGWPAVVRVSHETVYEDSGRDAVIAGTTPYCSSLPALLQKMLEDAESNQALVGAWTLSEAELAERREDEAYWRAVLKSLLWVLVALAVIIAVGIAIQKWQG
jgi:hypothetical protein